MPNPCTFEGLVVQLTEQHHYELDAVVQQFKFERNLLVTENEILRRQLKRYGITPQDLPPMEFQPEDNAKVDVTNDKPVWESAHSKLVPCTEFEDDNDGQLCTLLKAWTEEVDPACNKFLIAPHVKLPAGRQPSTFEDGGNWCVIFPNSSKRIAWDLFGLFLICYDLIMIPFTQAFRPPDLYILTVMEWFTLCFWTCDMAQGFFLGYFANGEYVDENYKVLINYFKTWFLVDCVVVLPDWSMKLLNSEQAVQWGELGKLLKGARAIRVMRVMRLLRLAKLQRLINLVLDKVQSEYTFIVVNLLKLLLFLLILNHLIACAWYGLAQAVESQTETNWILTANMIDDTILYKYLTSLHWSLTQFTPAGMDVSARNSPERVFSIVILFFAMVAFSSIVANITLSMSNLRNMKGDRTKQFWLLRRYFKQRGVAVELSERIFRFIEHRLDSKAGHVFQTQLPVLGHLSEALQNELNFHIMAGVFTKHEFFKQIDKEMPVILHVLSSKMRIRTYAEDEVIFARGSIATQCFFLKAGHLSYVPMHGFPVDPEVNDCIAEATLWIHWRHQGVLQTLNVSEMFDLTPDNFRYAMHLQPRSWIFAVSYARDFLHHITHLKRSEFNDVLPDDGFRLNSIAKICSSLPAN